MRRIDFDDPHSVPRIAEYSAQQAAGAVLDAVATTNVGPAAQFSRLFALARLPRHDVLHHGGHIRFGQPSDQHLADQRNDMSVDTAQVGGLGAGLFRAAALAEYPTLLKLRSEERRLGKEGVSPCKTRW